MFIARRYASAVLAQCLSVCLSVTSQSYVEVAEGIERVFGRRASFDLSYSVAW